MVHVFGGECLRVLEVPVVPFVTAASVIVTPLFQGVVPLLHSHHLVKGIDVHVGVVASSDVDKLLGHPICLVDHVLLGPVDFVLPVTDHFPGVVFNIFRNLARFDINTLSFINCVSGECSPVLNILRVYEVFAPSNRVVGSP